MSGEGVLAAVRVSGFGSSAAAARAAERDGFAVLLGRFQRQILRDAAAGHAVDGDLLARRVDAMLEQVAGGLHLTDVSADDGAV